MGEAGPVGKVAGDDSTQAKDEKLEQPEVVRFSPEEEAALLKESHTIKSEANSLFASKDYHNALSRYDDAINSCPNYLHYERAVVQSNIAACHISLEQWKEAIKAATTAIDGLSKLEVEQPELSNSVKPTKDDGKSEASVKDSKSGIDKPTSNNADSDADDVEEEIISSGAARAAPSPAQVAIQTRKADILRIRTKALLRRARARSEAGGWQNLAGAEEDYRTLSQMPGLTPADQRTVRSQLAALPRRTKAAQESETAEMWGKLKGLGNGILKPFGLSTDNFQMVKDEKTGGYSVNFSQGDASSKPS